MSDLQLVLWAAGVTLLGIGLGSLALLLPDGVWGDQ